MFRTFQIPLTWPELLKRTVKEFTEDNCLGLAAQVAYYLLLGLVPALIFLVAITGFLPPEFIGDTINKLNIKNFEDIKYLVPGLVFLVAFQLYVMV